MMVKILGPPPCSIFRGFSIVFASTGQDQGMLTSCLHLQHFSPFAFQLTDFTPGWIYFILFLSCPQRRIVPVPPAQQQTNQEQTRVSMHRSSTKENTHQTNKQTNDHHQTSQTKPPPQLLPQPPPKPPPTNKIKNHPNHPPTYHANTFSPPMATAMLWWLPQLICLIA